MRKTASKQEIEMLVSVDHATHILDLKVFTSPKKRVPAERHRQPQDARLA